MKKFLAAALVLFAALTVSAGSYGLADSMYIQPNIGIGAAFDKGNQFGIAPGVDIDFHVWKTGGPAAGDMFAGIDFQFAYWVPTEDTGNTKIHVMRMPIQGNFSYEFSTKGKPGAGPLTAAGPWYSMGVGLNFVAASGDGASALNDVMDHFEASFAWGIGGILTFNDKWTLKVGFGGDAGDHWDAAYFMAEAGMRFGF
ncbi:hypothetical protein J6Z39_08880 [bacterium]|nr:hypothetical protein [bacterium]